MRILLFLCESKTLRNPALACSLLLLGDLLLCHTLDAVHPNPLKLFFCEMAPDADHRFSGVAFLFQLFDPLLNDGLRPIDGTGFVGHLSHGRDVIVLYIIGHFLVVIVPDGQCFPFEEFCRCIEIRLSQTDDLFVGIG